MAQQSSGKKYEVNANGPEAKAMVVLKYFVFLYSVVSWSPTPGTWESAEL